MDFSTVKSLTIPEGTVTKITDASGTVLWQSSSSQSWHTLWEGDSDYGYCSSYGSTTYYSFDNGWYRNLLTGYSSDSTKFRITFMTQPSSSSAHTTAYSYTDSGTTSTLETWTGNTVKTFTDIETYPSPNNTIIHTITYSDSAAYTASSQLRIQTISGNTYIYGYGRRDNSSVPIIKLRILKVEQYY